MKETGRDTTWNGRCRQIGSGKNKAGSKKERRADISDQGCRQAFTHHSVLLHRLACIRKFAPPFLSLL
jgi:hypothetical protein